MENITKNGLDQFDSVSITDKSKIFLNEIAKWSKFLGIVGFIGCGLILFFALFFLAMDPFSKLTNGASLDNPFGSLSGSLFGIIYLVIGALYFMPSLYIYKAGNSLLKGIQQKNDHVMEVGLENLKSCFKFIGILTIVTVGFYFLAFGAGMIGSFF